MLFYTSSACDLPLPMYQINQSTDDFINMTVWVPFY